MAALEQLLFGFRADNEPRRSILAQSPGMTRDCAEEVIRFCEGWGAVPVEGIRRPVLMSFPLVTRLASLPGDLYVVIHVSAGLKPLYHAAVLSLTDYLEFDLNPYGLAQEDVFLSTWEPDLALARRELRPGALAPLVSPPPGPTDLGSIDEALRQILANQRLLLPLERSSSDSDRFLALTIASLPRVLRQNLRFAAWAPSGTNRYSLAATYREAAPFTSWQPYLMTSILGELSAPCEEYLTGVRRCLRDGDLAGLERLSASARVDLAHLGTSSKRTLPKALTATVPEHAAQAMEQRGKQAGRQRHAAATAAATPHAASARTDRPSTTASGSGPSRRRTRPLQHRHATNHKRNAAVLLFAVVFVAGGYFFWAVHHTRPAPVAPSDAAAEVTAAGAKTKTAKPAAAAAAVDVTVPPPASRDDIVDVGQLYRRLLAGTRQAGQTDVAALDADRRRRGLEALAQAQLTLTAQGRSYLAAAEDRLAGTAAGENVAEDAADRLWTRGQLLARELRRLALAQVSLRDQVDWRDLADLEQPRLVSRLDSLLARRQAQAPLEPALAEVQQLLAGVDLRTRQIGGVVSLETLLASERWEPRWNDDCETAVDALVGVRQARARRLRDDALLLVRLKRAEHATGFADQAFLATYGPWALENPAVADILPDVFERGQASGEDAPALLRATAAFYTALARAAVPNAPFDLVAATLVDLAENRASRFDPGAYGDHLARLRFTLLERLTAAGTPAQELPAICFDGGDPGEHLDFLAMLASAPDAAAWQLHAANLTDPFLMRWARHLAGGQTAGQAAGQADEGPAPVNLAQPPADWSDL
jgi:hypothetical protein